MRRPTITDDDVDSSGSDDSSDSKSDGSAHFTVLKQVLFTK